MNLKNFALCNAHLRKSAAFSMRQTKQGDTENEKANKNEFAGF